MTRKQAVDSKDDQEKKSDLTEAAAAEAAAAEAAAAEAAAAEAAAAEAAAAEAAAGVPAWLLDEMAVRACGGQVDDLDADVVAFVMLRSGDALIPGWFFPLMAADLAEHGHFIRVKPKIAIKADVNRCMLHGLVLCRRGGRRAECDLVTPLAIGGGRGATMAADSLVFRPVAEAEPAEA